jgi:glycosyltransferase involved in cell wall biosynthesis
VAITHRENGLLVPPRSAEAIAEAIRFLLEHPDEARRIGENGRAFVRARCSLDTMIEAMIARFEVHAPVSDLPDTP